MLVERAVDSVEDGDWMVTIRTMMLTKTDLDCCVTDQTLSKRIVMILEPIQPKWHGQLIPMAMSQ